MAELLEASITIDALSNTHTVALAGEFDHGTSRDLCTTLDRMAARAPDARWLIDTSGLDFVDSSVVNLLVMLEHRASTQGSVTVLPTPMLVRILEATGLHRFVGSAARR